MRSGSRLRRRPWSMERLARCSRWRPRQAPRLGHRGEAHRQRLAHVRERRLPRVDALIVAAEPAALRTGDPPARPPRLASAADRQACRNEPYGRGPRAAFVPSTVDRAPRCCPRDLATRSASTAPVASSRRGRRARSRRGRPSGSSPGRRRCSRPSPTPASAASTSADARRRGPPRRGVPWRGGLEHEAVRATRVSAPSGGRHVVARLGGAGERVLSPVTSAVSQLARQPAPGRRLADLHDLRLDADLRPERRWRLEIGGLVQAAAEPDLRRAAALPRAEQVSTFHCVTGWTVEGRPLGGRALPAPARPRRAAARGEGDPLRLARGAVRRLAHARAGAAARRDARLRDRRQAALASARRRRRAS